MVVPMLRPDVFGALASHAGDALFECCYLREFPRVARALRDHFDGSYEVFLERLADADHFDWARFGKPFEMYGYACAYSPDPDVPARRCCRSTLATGRLIDDVWERWLEHDPVRMAPHARRRAAQHAPDLPRRRQAATSTSSTSARRRSPQELSKLGVEHTLELFDGKHGGITYRYPGAIRELRRRSRCACDA